MFGFKKRRSLDDIRAQIDHAKATVLELSNLPSVSSVSVNNHGINSYFRELRDVKTDVTKATN